MADCPIDSETSSAAQNAALFTLMDFTTVRAQVAVPALPPEQATRLRDDLVAAGIERAGALAAVTNGDNSNILVARTAREFFGVERVVARIYDQARPAPNLRAGCRARAA